MVTKTVSGIVYVDTVEGGFFTLEYEDVKEVRLSEAKATRTLTANVYLDDVVVGYASLNYEDLIASGFGGKRTVTLKGDVVLE